MSSQQKLQQRILSNPKDFTWSELMVLMRSFSYELKRSGGSGRIFVHPVNGAKLFIHEPHPSKILKVYQVKAVVRLLQQEGDLNERNAPP